MGETIRSDNTSSAENIKEKRETMRVQQQVKEELNSLRAGVADNFYEKKEDGSVSFRMDLVKEYLTKLYDKVKDKTTAEAWNELKKQNTAAWMMAVQIALEKLDYDVGVIDGLYGPSTKRGIVDFQKANGLTPD